MSLWLTTLLFFTMLRPGEAFQEDHLESDEDLLLHHESASFSISDHPHLDSCCSLQSMSSKYLLRRLGSTNNHSIHFHTSQDDQIDYANGSLRRKGRRSAEGEPQPMMQRYPDWQIRLRSYLQAVTRTPFEPGSNDCALFLAGGVEAMTGVDYAMPYRGRYTTLRGGLRVLKKEGFEDHIDLARSHLPEKPVAFANVGDGAVVLDGNEPALGIVQGASVFVLTETGLGHVPLTAAATVLEV